MTTEYVVLGILLILMGGIQIWLRHGPGAPGSGAGEDGEESGQERGRGVRPPLGAGRIRSGRAWEAWTAVLGFIGVGFGLVLVVLGALGR